MGGIVRRRELLGGGRTPLTWDLSVEVPTPGNILPGDKLVAPCTDAAIQIALPKGRYSIEAWGANGGQSQSDRGTPLAKGGYSVGTLTLASQTDAYIVTGGAGKTGYLSGGFNGGGNCTTLNPGNNNGGGGGGGSDVRLRQNDLLARVIVAGGGGGISNYSTSGNFAGDGGGIEGGYGIGSSSATVYHNNGGTQTAGGTPGSRGGEAGSFGQGGNTTGSTANTRYKAGGGGGGWYGGAGGNNGSTQGNNGSGGGGSGYVYTAATAGNYPAGCLLTSEDYLTDAATYQGGSIPAGSGKPVAGSDGYIRITVL